MRFVDFFAGIGGFRKGLEQSGHRCVYSCEIDNNARKSYSAIYNLNIDVDNVNEDNNEDEIFARDIKNVQTAEMPEYDILCGGFPCQPFSRAGRRDGFNDEEKGNLFFEVMRIVAETRPRIVFLENVKGLLTSGEKVAIENEDGTNINKEINKGATFRKILQELDELGYNVEWQLINSAHFIAHKRERVYIIAKLRDNIAVNRTFPIHTEVLELNVYDIRRDFSRVYEDFREDIRANTLQRFRMDIDEMHSCNIETGVREKTYQFGTVSPWGNWGIMIDGDCITCKINHEPERIYALRDMLQAHDEIEEKYILSDEEVEKQRYSKSGRTWAKSGNKMGNMAFPDNLDKPSRTLTANSSGREMMVIGFEQNGIEKFRKLTSLEYWKLQGFSEEDYNKAVAAGVPDTQLKKQAGNAVTVDVIRAIGERLPIE